MRAKEIVLVNKLAIAAPAGTDTYLTVPAAGAAATSKATGTATSSTGFLAVDPPSDTCPPAIPPSGTGLPVFPPFNDQLPDLPIDMDYIATTSGGMLGYGVTDGGTTGLLSGVFNPYTSIPPQAIPSDPFDQTAFDPSRTAGLSTVMAQGSATVRGRKRALPHDTTQKDDKGGSKKRRKANINNQLAPSGSGVPTANQESTAQASFAPMPWPEGMSPVEYGALINAQFAREFGGARRAA